MVIPHIYCCHRIIVNIFIEFNFIELYIGMTISKSSVLYIKVLLIFDMHDLNKALFLNVTSFSEL